MPIPTLAFLMRAAPVGCSGCWLAIALKIEPNSHRIWTSSNSTTHTGSHKLVSLISLVRMFTAVILVRLYYTTWYHMAKLNENHSCKWAFMILLLLVSSSSTFCTTISAYHLNLIFLYNKNLWSYFHGLVRKFCEAIWNKQECLWMTFLSCLSCLSCYVSASL